MAQMKCIPNVLYYYSHFLDNKSPKGKPSSKIPQHARGKAGTQI
jgi:hypothetical protein